MKRLFAFFIIVFLYPYLTTAGELTASLSFDKTQLSFSVLQGYDVVELDGCDFTYEVGKPMLPIKILHLLLPPGAEVTGYQVTYVDSEYLPKEYLIYPVQPNIPFPETPLEFIPPDSSTYSSSSPYPVNLIEYATTGSMGGYAIAGLKAYPVQYIPAQRKLVFYHRIDFVVQYNEELVSLPARSEIGEHFYNSIVSKLVLNPENLSLYSFPKTDDSFDYVIITHPDYVSAFQPLADWKTAKGIKTQIVTTSWIYSNYTQGDNARRIKCYLYDVWQNDGVVWALLGGDTDKVPHRMVKLVADFSPYYPIYVDYGPCDLYFSDLTHAYRYNDWNYNNNSWYGEDEDDPRIDMYPDVFVGRAPVNSFSEAQTFVNKVLTYEQNPPTDYQLKMLFLASNLRPFDPWPSVYYTPMGEFKDDLDDYVPSRFNITKLYWDQWNDDLNLWAAISEINDGYNIINHIDHGQYDAIKMGAGPWLDCADADALTNGDRQSVFYTCACKVAGFDHDAVSEHFMNNAGGGTVAFIGNSRYGFYKPGHPGDGVSDKYDEEFIVSLFSDNINRIGATLADSKEEFVPNCWDYTGGYRWIQFNLNLLGDPEMPVWTNSPQQLSVDVPEYTYPGSECMVTVKKASNDIPIEDALVCLMKEDEVYEAGYTNANGQVILNIPETTTSGDIVYTVTAQDYLYVTGIIHIDMTPPNVHVTRPQSSTNWACGSTHNIRWNASDNQSGIFEIEKIEYSIDGGTSWITPPIAEHEENDGVYLWTVAYTPSTNCKVRVTAVNWAGEPAYDDSPVFRIRPSSPTGLSGVWEHFDKDCAVITLNWEQNPEPDLSGYYVYRSESSSGPFNNVGTVGPLETPVFAERVYAWCPYWYYVKAFDTPGNKSSPSNTIKVKPEFYPVPCPFLFTWNGSEFIEDNNILAGSGQGEVVTDPYKLTQSLVETEPPRRYKLEIREEETEHSFFDMVSLKVVDHLEDVEIGVNVENEIISVSIAHTPVSAISGGDDYADVLSNDTTWFEGCEGDTMVVEFGIIDEVDDKELWLESDKSGYPISIEIEGEDGWVYVTSVFPRDNFSNIPITSLSELIDNEEALTLRLVWFADHNLKTIRIVQPGDELLLERTSSLVFAIHSRLGNVKQMLLNEDENYVDVLPGDTLRLIFAFLPKLPRWTRSFVFVSNGYYIMEGDGGAQTATSDIPLIHSLSLYPNPAKNNMTIRFGLPKEERVSLKVYDVSGREVKTLEDGRLKAGYYTIRLVNMNLPSGIYFARLVTDNYEETRKLVLMK
ncbi:T9SS type A sorting domain-containing protein [candidate division WOR-3 bacterium]|nr:T9SS type A sorting domain-containing protein [candidate division WOR-3 bacterium]